MFRCRHSLILVFALVVCPGLLAEPGGCVVLLHGLARTYNSMEELADKLSEQGYITVNQGYPSTDAPVDQLAQQAIPAALAQCPEGAPVHFVTHSMGGILVRQYLAANTIDQLGRVVMLGPPNQGSEVVDRLAGWPVFEWLNGPAGLQLGTGDMSLPLQLGPASFEVGIIAGERSINPILSTIIPAEDDGKVAVANTRLANMSDHIILPVNHTFMMNDDEVIRQVLHFLAVGRFDHPSKGSLDADPASQSLVPGV